MDFEAARKAFLDSERGVRAANQELAALRTELEGAIASVSDSITLRLEYFAQGYGHMLLVTGLPGRSISVEWECVYNNTLDESSLNLVAWDGYPGRGFLATRGKPPRKLWAVELRLDLLSTDQVAWVSRDSDSTAYHTRDLAALVLRSYMDVAGGK
jgi:hypothetical protein